MHRQMTSQGRMGFAVLLAFISLSFFAKTLSAAEKHPTETNKNQEWAQYLGALEYNDLGAIMSYIHRGLGYEWRTTDDLLEAPFPGMNTLHWAAFHGNIALAAEILRDCRERLNERTAARPALHMRAVAERTGQVEFVRWLSEQQGVEPPPRERQPQQHLGAMIDRLMESIATDMLGLPGTAQPRADDPRAEKEEARRAEETPRQRSETEVMPLEIDSAKLEGSASRRTPSIETRDPVDDQYDRLPSNIQRVLAEGFPFLKD